MEISYINLWWFNISLIPVLVFSLLHKALPESPITQLQYIQKELFLERPTHDIEFQSGHRKQKVKLYVEAGCKLGENKV